MSQTQTRSPQLRKSLGYYNMGANSKSQDFPDRPPKPLVPWHTASQVLILSEFSLTGPHFSSQFTSQLQLPYLLSVQNSDSLLYTPPRGYQEFLFLSLNKSSIFCSLLIVCVAQSSWSGDKNQTGKKISNSYSCEPPCPALCDMIYQYLSMLKLGSWYMSEMPALGRPRQEDHEL